MTQKYGQEPENRKWMEIAESDAVNEVRHSRNRLPYVAAAFALLVVGGGALFAQTNPLKPAQVIPSSVVASVATALPTTMQQPVDQGATITPPVVVNGIPTIAPGGGGYDNEDDEDDEDDNEDDEDEDDD